jgi:hypothetical protein
MIQLIKDHKWALVFAFLVSVIFVFPQVYFSFDHGDAYQGIYISDTDNEYSYLARIREVQDGHPSLGGVLSQDGKGDPYMQPPGGEILVGYAGRILSLDLNSTVLLARFIFPFLAFLAIYAFVFLITKEKLTALVAGIAVFFAEPLLSRGTILSILHGQAQSGFLDFYRPIHPQVSTTLYFLFLPFFWLFINSVAGLSSKKQWVFGAFSTLILAFSFYVYPYTWSIIYSFLGVLCLIFIFQKKWSEFRKVIFVGSTAFLLGIGYFLNVYQAMTHPYFQELVVRFRYIGTHHLVLGFLVPSMIIIFLLFFPRRWKERFVFCLSLVVAPLIALNQQIITGREFSSGHYHWFYNQPTAVIFLIIILFFQLGSWQEKLVFLRRINVKKIVAFLIISASLYTGIFIQASSYRSADERIASDQRYGPVARWLSANAHKDEVFLADSYQAEILSIYTPLNPFYSISSYLYFSASNERVLNSLFVFYRLDGVTAVGARSLFLQKDERHLISKRIYGTYYKNIAGRADAIPDEILLSFADKYKEFLASPLDKIFKTYNIKYVVWDKRDYPDWDLGQYQFLGKVYEEGDFAIFINKQL